jgi:hypothetical protein
MDKTKDGLDATVALAVMAKATKVFGRDNDAFLSFPITPVFFEKQQLDFLDGTPTNRALLDLSEFSRLVNLIPRGTIWNPGEERYLWDAYREMLEGADCPASTRTPAEEARYQRAMRYLYETGKPSPAALAYEQCRHAYEETMWEFNKRQSAADSSSQPEVKEQWRRVEEPALRAEIRRKEEEWRTAGFKEPVETARVELRLLSGQSPGQTIEEWRARFLDGIDKKTDTNLLGFLPSAYSPLNAFETGAWRRFTLTRDEAGALIGQAPANLRGALASQPLSLEIESLSVEYSYVNITRPWLAAEAFHARFWKFRERGKQLSDGGTPPAGSCPAYVTGLVFARNLEIKLKENSAKNDAVADRLRDGKPLSLGFMPFVARESHLLTNPLAPMTPKPAPIGLPANLAGLQASLKGLQEAAFLSKPLEPVWGGQFTPVKPGTEFQTQPWRPNLIPIGIGLPGLFPRGRAAAANEGLYVMAFVCKRLPRCPDPDPALPWS